MSHVFIVGGSGQVAKKLIEKLSKSSIPVTAMYRNESQESDLEALGAIPVHADITQITIDDLAQLLKDSQADTVVFSAGAGGKGGQETTTLVDGKGLELAVNATKKAGIKKFILVSAFPEAGRSKGLGENFEHYIQVKKQSEYFLIQSGLEWLILRPGTLLNDEGTGLVNIGLALPYGTITRDDVATTLAALIQSSGLKYKILELTQGNEKIETALEKV